MASRLYGSPSKKPFLPAFHRSSAERCKLEWAIVNFHGFFQRLDGGTVQGLSSNVFTASCSKFTSNSTWRLKIHPKYFHKGSEFVAIALERCFSKESIPSVTAFIRLGICCTGGEIGFKQSYTHDFREGDVLDFPLIIERKYLIENRKRTMPDDTLTVLCELDIYTEECCKFFDDIYLNSPPELKELSNDMRSFFHATRNTDINLHTDSKLNANNVVQLQSHKAILGSRSPLLAKSIEVYAGDSMELKVHSDVVMRFLEYIYCGNLSLLFVDFRLLSGLFEAAKACEVSDLESFLEPEAIHCRSIIPAYKYKFDWRIANFNRCQGCGDVEFDGPTTKWFAAGEVEWKLSLSIKNIRDSDVTPVSVNLSRKTSSPMYHQVMFEASVLNIRSEFVAVSKAEFVFLNDGERGIDIISREEIFSNEFILYKKSLNIYFDFVVSSPSVETTTEMSEFNVVCDLLDAEDSDLRGLSNDFEKLFLQDQYKDMTINARDGKIKVHECIIDARCHCLITNETLKNQLAEMPATIVKSFVKFLYTGEKKYLRDHALQFYFLAKELNLEELKQQYLSRLDWILSAENVLDVIQEAHRADDQALKSMALKFIKEGEEELLDTEDFQVLKTGNSALAEEIIAFVGSNVQ